MQPFRARRAHAARDAYTTRCSGMSRSRTSSPQPEWNPDIRATAAPIRTLLLLIEASPLLAAQSLRLVRGPPDVLGVLHGS